MATLMTWLKQGFLTAALAATAVACLLVFILLACAFRLILMVALVACLAGSAVLCCCSPRFRQWFATLGEPEISYHGLRFATDLAVYPGHSWAAVSPQNVAVGVERPPPSRVRPRGGGRIASAG